MNMFKLFLSNTVMAGNKKEYYLFIQHSYGWEQKRVLSFYPTQLWLGTKKSIIRSMIFTKSYKS